MRGARRAVPRTVALHLAREFLWAFALTLGAFIAIYVIADFFDRFDTFLRHDASGGAIVRYFLFKIPLVVTQATPLAVLTGGIVGLGLLARQHEFVALRACGVSIWQMITPLLALAALISVAAVALDGSLLLDQRRGAQAAVPADRRAAQPALPASSARSAGDRLQQGCRGIRHGDRHHGLLAPR